jgi:hypothetical protein
MNTDIYIVNIDTKFKNPIYTNSGDFVYTFIEPLKNIMSIKLSSIEFPNLYYTFSQKKKNNFFNIKYNNIYYTVTIKDGIYSADSLIDHIQHELQHINKQLCTHFKIHYDGVKFNVHIHNTTTFELDFNNKDSNLLSLGYYLGYRQLIYNTPIKKQRHHDNHTHTEYKYKSESIIDTQGESYFFIKINDFNNVIQDYTMFNGNNYTIRQETQKYFAKILLNGPKMSTIFDTGANFLYKTYNMRQPENLAKLTIQLYDSAGYIIDMLNFNYSLTLEIKYIISSSVKQSLESAPTGIVMSQPIIDDQWNTTLIQNTMENQYPIKIKKNKYDFSYNT